MRIALLTDGLHPFILGGMQKHSTETARYLARRKCVVDLYYCIPDGISFSPSIFSDEEWQFINPIEVKFPSLPYFPGHYLAASYIYSKRIFQTLLSRKLPDFIYCQGFTGWYLLDNPLLKEIPVGVNFHGLNMFQRSFGIRSRLTSLMFKPVVKHILKRSDVVFSLGGSLTGIIQQQGVDISRIAEVPVGVSASWISAPRKSNVPLRFVFVGRFDPIKGIDVLFKVLEKTRDLNCEFHFIGPFPEEKRIKAAGVVFHGSINNEDELKTLVRQMDVLVLPSYSEGMPTVIIEAMMSGLSVIATDVGAVRVLIDPSNGILIPPGNVPALKSAIQAVLKLSDDKLFELKKASFDKASSLFTWEVVINRTIAEIQDRLS